MLPLSHQRTTDNKGHTCLSHLPVWLAGKENNLHVDEGRSWVVGQWNLEQKPS